MFPYYLVFVVALFYYFVSAVNRKSALLLFAFFAYVALFVGFGDMIGGYDRYIYGEAFDGIADCTTRGDSYVTMYYLVDGQEWGYFWWQVLISLITTNRYVFILITTLLAYALFFRAFTKYLDDYPLACILFLGFFYYFTMTYLRQVIAVGIVWQGMRYIWERKPLKFFLVLVLAASFHNAILIFAVMYFIPIRKYSKSLVLTIILVCFVIGVTPLPNAVLGFAGDTTGKGNYTSQDQGFRIEYVLEAAFIVWVLFTNYKKIANDKKTLVFTNMCFALCCILMFFMRFGQGGRFSWGFFFGIFYMLTTLTDQPKAFGWMKSLVIVVSFLLFLRITLAWRGLIEPYKTFTTDGIPSAPEMYDQNEYDANYTVDKFYRPAFR